MTAEELAKTINTMIVVGKEWDDILAVAKKQLDDTYKEGYAHGYVSGYENGLSGSNYKREYYNIWLRDESGNLI